MVVGRQTLRVNSKLHRDKKKVVKGDTALAVACLGGDERYDMVKLLSADKYRMTINMMSTARPSALCVLVAVSSEY